MVMKISKFLTEVFILARKEIGERVENKRKKNHLPQPPVTIHQTLRNLFLVWVLLLLLLE
eukprot:UN18499